MIDIIITLCGLWLLANIVMAVYLVYLVVLQKIENRQAAK